MWRARTVEPVAILGHRHGRALTLTQEIDVAVIHDAKQPWSERLNALNFVEPGIELDQYVLHQIFCVFGVAQ